MSLIQMVRYLRRSPLDRSSAHASKRGERGKREPLRLLPCFGNPDGSGISQFPEVAFVLRGGRIVNRDVEADLGGACERVQTQHHIEMPALAPRLPFQPHNRTHRTGFLDHGAIAYVVDESSPPHDGRPGRLVTRIADDDLPFGGRWIHQVVRVGSGTRVTITEDGLVKSVLFRFASRYVFGHTRTLDDFLRDLGTHLGSAVEPAGAEPAA